MRTAFIETLCELASADEGIWLLTGDLGFSVVERFSSRFRDRFVNVGVAEQNMAGIAAGLAMTGRTVFVYSIANFPTLRCLEQIRNDICYHRANVKIVAVGGGFTYGEHGMTHHGIEDISVIRAIPGIAVVSPGDAVESRLATKEISEMNGPCYMRLGKAGEPLVHADIPSFAKGKVVPLRNGTDILIVATGSILANAVEAAEILSRKGLSPAVWSCPWIRPFDEQAIAEAAEKFDLIVTLEEAQRNGGLGGIVSETVSSLAKLRPCVLRLGVPDIFLEEAYSQKDARVRLRLDPLGISEDILSKLAQVRGKTI